MKTLFLILLVLILSTGCITTKKRIHIHLNDRGLRYKGKVVLTYHF